MIFALWRLTMSIRSVELNRGENLLQKFTVGARIRRGLFRRRAHLAALDHHRPVESAGFQLLEDAGEIHFARAKLDHHVAFHFAAIFRAEASDASPDRLDLGPGFF